MKAEYFTKVGACDVPVIGAKKPTISCFEDGYGGKMGVFAFWTAEFKKKVRGRNKIWGRARVGLPAGDRFDRMGRKSELESVPKDDVPIYKALFNDMGKGRNIKLIRPSTDEEVYQWLKTHSSQRFGRCVPLT